MNIHYLQHVPFEGPGVIRAWSESRGYCISSTALYQGEVLPDPSQVDALVVLGGPMNIHDVDKYPWLFQEKDFIWQCIQQKKKVLGICLGAQLIAQVLGAEVYSNRVKEIGWYYITWNSCARSHPIFNFLPCRQITFHWHSDTFRLPAGAVRLASSRYSKNQAFVYENHVVGLQFHLEMGREDLIQLIENNKEGLKERGPHIQSAEHILDRPEHIKSNNITMIQFLDRFLTDALKTVPEIKTAPEHY